MALRHAPTLLSLSLLACGSDPVGEPAQPAPEPVECEPGPGYADTAVVPTHVGAVDAVVLGTDGAPPETDILAQVCGVNVGTNVCINGTVEADGAVSVPTDHDIPRPAFKYGDGLVYGKLALLLEDAADGLELGTLYLPQLPETGAALVAGERADSGDVTLVLSPATQVEIDRLFYRSEADRAFRAAELPATRFADGFTADSGVELVFALAPYDATFCPPAAVELPNRLGWAAGTPVELLLQGFDIDTQPWAPYGAWAVVALGEVDASGARIVTTEGGLPLLSNVGVRRR